MQTKMSRRNFRGREVSLWGGVALWAGWTLLHLSAAVKYRNPHHAQVALAAAGGGAAGLYDDLADETAENKSTKGFKGHLGALREGRLSPGLVKMFALIATGLVAAKPRRDLVGWVVHAGVIAGGANLVNLLDLRPGRALKLGAVVAGAGLAPGTTICARTTRRMVALNAAATAASLPTDLTERTMLGDTGANALGAAVFATWAQGRSTRARLLALTLIAAATLLSEKVSFSKIIENTPPLKAWDDWGRVD